MLPSSHITPQPHDGRTMPHHAPHALPAAIEVQEGAEHPARAPALQPTKLPRLSGIYGAASGHLAMHVNQNQAAQFQPLHPAAGSSSRTPLARLPAFTPSTSWQIHPRAAHLTATVTPAPPSTSCNIFIPSRAESPISLLGQCYDEEY